MKSSKKALAFALAAAMVVTAFPVTNAEAASTAKLNKKSVTVAAGTAAKQTKSIKVTTPSTWKSVKVKVSSSNKKIATVKASGKTVKVTAVKKGSAKVTVKVTAKKAGKAVSKTLKANVKVVGAGLKFTSDAAEVNTGATLALSVKKVPSVAKLTFASKDETIATVSPDGVVTGVKAGKTTITVTSDYGKTIEKEITVKDTVANLSTVAQTASNAFTATFTADASKTYTKDDIAVAAADGSNVLAVKSVEYSQDGLSAKVTVFGTFVNGTAYKVTCKDVTLDMTAKVGAVARVAIETASAEKNVETPIEFKLFDADGIDVTPSVSVDTTCFVTVTGTYSAIDTSKASKSTITMSNVKDEAEVTVTYNSNENGAQDVTATQKITCVDAKIINGNKLFASQRADLNPNNYCTKFYLGLSDESVNTVVDGTATTYFCAKDGDKVISYDSYEVESSNDDVATADVTTSKDSGRFAEITVNGHKEGSAQVNVKATKNGQAKYYTIPVSVKKVSELTQMNVSVTKPTMSNVNDSDYTGTIKVELLDQYKNKMNGAVDFKIKTVTSGTSLSLDSIPNTMTNSITSWNVGDHFEQNYYAQDATAKTYTIEVTGADPRTGKTIVRNINVTVKNIDLSAVRDWSKLSYQVELSTATIDENPIDEKGWTKTWDDKATARLYATYNGLFAGYVRDNGTNVTVADQNTDFKNVMVSATFGTHTYGAGDLFDASNNAATRIATSGDTFNAVKSADVEWYADDTVNTTLAKVGNYTIKYVITKAGNKTIEKTRTLSVKNSVVVPKVTVNSRTVETLNVNDILKVLSTNVDMNNKDGDTSALTGIRHNTPTNNKVTVSDAIVSDTYNSVDWDFYVPINTTFKTE